jgi:hypothetical protein
VHPPIIRQPTDRLVEQIKNLLEIADVQKQLAKDAAKQGNRLIKLTWALFGVSAALLLFAIVQTALMLKQDANAHAQQIQAGQHEQGAASN